MSSTTRSRCSQPTRKSGVVHELEGFFELTAVAMHNGEVGHEDDVGIFILIVSSNARFVSSFKGPGRFFVFDSDIADLAEQIREDEGL